MRHTPSGNLREIRTGAIENMKEALAHVETAEAPLWLIAILVIPLWTWEVTKVVLKFLLSIIGVYLTAPVVGLYYLIDTIIVMTWFFRQIVLKMGKRS